MTNKFTIEPKKLFIFAIIILLAKIFSIAMQINGIFKGEILNSDFLGLGMNVGFSTILMLVSKNKHWRIGILFIIASTVTHSLSSIIYQRSLSVNLPSVFNQPSIGWAMALSITSALFLLVAAFYFCKLKTPVQ